MNTQSLFCLIGKRWAWKDQLASSLWLPTTTVSDVLKDYCREHNLAPTRDTLTQLGNTIFDGQTLASALAQQLPDWGIITWLRKPDTLLHLMRDHRCLLIGVLADDYLRWQRVSQRNRLGDTMSYAHFLEHERQENALPNKQNIDLLLAFCDVHITNNTSLEELLSQGKQALQQTLLRPQSLVHIDAQGYQHFTRAILLNEEDEVLVFWDKKKQLHTLPGGKCDTGETPDICATREVEEETGISTQLTYCGSFLWLFRDGLSKGHFFHGTVNKKEISLQEPDIHSEMIWIPKKDLLNTLGFQAFLDSGLYHYIHNQRVHNRCNTRAYDSKNRQPEELLIQYLDPQTGKIYITPREEKLSPLYTPLRIMHASQIKAGREAQIERGRKNIQWSLHETSIYI
jgi:ADP-ribose pyrophosphatase YjhB (NUDIX family)